MTKVRTDELRAQPLIGACITVGDCGTAMAGAFSKLTGGDYPPLPDFETVEQHIYGACRRYITQDMLEPIHNLIRDAIDADRALADSVTAPAGGAVAEPEFDDCPASPTGKHSASWFANDDCEHCKSGAQPDAPLLYTPTAPAQAADSVMEDAARLERERICAAIKAEDDYCVDHGDYMLDSDDCIKIVRGEWVRPDFFVTAARKQGANHD